MELSYPGSLYKSNASNFGTGENVADSTGHKLNVDSAHWHLWEPSYKDSSFDYKTTQYEYPFASTGFGTSSVRSRTSFLDSLGVSRGSSMAYVPYEEPEKAKTTGSFAISNTQGTKVPLSSSFAEQFLEFNTADHSLNSVIPDFRSDEELTMNSLVSSNDGKLREPSGDHHAQRDHELFTSKKDEDFVALEQVPIFYDLHFSSLHAYNDYLFLKLMHGILDNCFHSFYALDKKLFALEQLFNF